MLQRNFKNILKKNIFMVVAYNKDDTALMSNVDQIISLIFWCIYFLYCTGLESILVRMFMDVQGLMFNDLNYSTLQHNDVNARKKSAVYIFKKSTQSTQPSHVLIPFINN